MSKPIFPDFRDQPDESSEFWVYVTLPGGRSGYLPFEPDAAQRTVLELMAAGVYKYRAHPSSAGADGLALYDAYRKRNDEPVSVLKPHDITDAELDALFEQSKDDKVIVVGSDIRRLIGALRRARARQPSDRTDKLEVVFNGKEDDGRLMATGRLYRDGEVVNSTDVYGMSEANLGLKVVEALLMTGGPVQAESSTLNTLRDAAHRNIWEKGFWDGQRKCPRCVDPENRVSLLLGGVDPDKNCGVCRGTKLTDKLDRDAVLKTIPEKLMLIVTELAEAMEEYRSPETRLQFTALKFEVSDGERTARTDCPTAADGTLRKPVGFASELADVLIRVFDLAGALGIDLDEAVRVKMRYNATRERMHGKSC